MKKILLLLSLLLSVSLVFAQNSTKGCRIVNAASNGSLLAGSSCTVDQVSWFNKEQTTPGRTFTIPNSGSSTVGRIIDILNDSISGSVSFTLVPGGVLEPNERISLRWQGTRWTVEGKWKNLPAFTALGDISMRSPNVIKNESAPTNFIRIAASSLEVNAGNSELDLSTAQNMIVTAPQGITVNTDASPILFTNGTDGALFEPSSITLQSTAADRTTQLLATSTPGVLVQHTTSGHSHILLFPSGISTDYSATLPARTGTIATTNDLNFTLSTTSNIVDINTKGLIFKDGSVTKWHVGDNVFYDNSNVESADMINRYLKNNAGSIILNYSSASNGLGISNVGSSNFGRIKNTNLSTTRTYELPNSSGTFALIESATNGLTGSGTNIKLGGSLSENTTITTGSNNFTVDKGDFTTSLTVQPTFVRLGYGIFAGSTNTLQFTSTAGTFTNDVTGGSINLNATGSGGQVKIKTGSGSAAIHNTIGLSTDRTFSYPDASGTFALTSDVAGAVSGTTGRAAYFTGTNAVGSSANYLWDNTNNILSVNGIYKVPSTGTGFRIFNTVDETTNTEYLQIDKSGNNFRVATFNSGTGTLRNLALVGNSRQLLIGTSSAIGFFNFTGTTSATGISIVGITGTISNSSLVNNGYSFLNTINQSGTAGFRCSWMSPLLTAVGSGPQLFADWGTNTLADGAGTHTSRFLMDVNGTSMIGSGSATDLTTAKWSVYSSSLINQRWAFDASNKCEVTVGSTGNTGFTLTGTNPEFSFNTLVRFPAGFTTAASLQNSNFGTAPNVSGSGVGQTANNSTVLLSTATAMSYRNIIRGSTQTTIPVGEGYATLLIGGQGYTEAASGNHPISVQVGIKPLVIANAGATTDLTATVYIEGASTQGTSNYSLFVDAGTTRFEGTVEFASGSLFSVFNGVNFALGSATGSKFGTSANDKIGFWNATPIIQPTTGIAASTFTANTSGIVNDTATWDGYTIGQVVKALRNMGLLQ